MRKYRITNNIQNDVTIYYIEYLVKNNYKYRLAYDHFPKLTNFLFGNKYEKWISKKERYLNLYDAKVAMSVFIANDRGKINKQIKESFDSDIKVDIPKVSYQN